MFELSAQGDYGLMLLSQLAKSPQNQYIKLSEVAKLHGLPVKYMEKVARQLSKAKIISSKEGKSGGYKLTKPPKQIKLNLILEALEDKVEPIICSQGCSSCERQSACEQKTGWKKIHNQLYSMTKKITLADLIANQ